MKNSASTNSIVSATILAVIGFFIALAFNNFLEPLYKGAGGFFLVLLVILQVIAWVSYVGFPVLGAILGITLFRNKENVSFFESNHYYDTKKEYNQDDLRKIEKEAISRGILAPGKKGQYIDKQTGKFKEEFFFNLLSRNTDDRIDLKTGKYQTTNFFGIKTDTGKKIDLESGRIYKKKDFGYEKTETRINQTTGRIEKKDDLGIFWNKTDERINPRTGKKEKKDDLGIFWNEVDK